MKKIDVLYKKFERAKANLNSVSFERKDTSYRRSGGYFGTNSADLNGVIVVQTIARTKHLNTYVCVSPADKQFADEFWAATDAIKKEQERLLKIAQKKWANESIKKAIDFTERQILDGTVLTNYVKVFVQGDKNIYACHPYHQHRDYNKFKAMPNTPKHMKVAKMLNDKLIAAGVRFENHI